MRVIGAIDLAGGRAVRARSGDRALYKPVETVAGIRIDSGDALALAAAYLDDLGLTELYAADLDAILGQGTQDALITKLAALGAPLWVDAGVSSVPQARHLLDGGAARVVVGLETLPSFTVLGNICEEIGPDRVVFSLDLRSGEPIITSARIPSGAPAHVLAAHAKGAGVQTVILIDLARVGNCQGLDLELISRVRLATPDLELVAGGGVRGPEDLAELAATGCDGALVATALHGGHIGIAEIAAARGS